MHLNLIAFAVPLFLSLMFAEYLVSRRMGLAVYHLPETVTNINVGIAERLSDLFTTGLFYFVFGYIYEHWRLFTIEAGWWQWIFLFIFTDFIWYWYHRFGHEVNILWAAHVVHHQSEDFNYTVSARITVFQSMARGAFWSLLPLLGFAPSATYIMLLIHGAYPFFTHTQLIGKLGVLEYFLVTPSHHRVHHSSNPEYLDKNYGDVLIIWDKLFGTFIAEKTQPVYGLTTALESHSFLWQHFHFVLELGIAFRRASTFAAKLKVLFGKPDDIDPSIRPYLERKLLCKGQYRPLNTRLKQYVIVQTIIVLLGLFCCLLFEQYFGPFQLLTASLLILVSVIISGAMLEQKKWSFELEVLRCCILLVYVSVVFTSAFGLLLPLVIILFLALYYNTIKQHYRLLFFGQV